jgi:hypothetical protein
MLNQALFKPMRFVCLLATLLLLSCGPSLPGWSDSACGDSRYLELKRVPLDSMSARDYDYFQAKDRECQEYTRALREAGSPSSPFGILAYLFIFGVLGAFFALISLLM